MDQNQSKKNVIRFRLMCLYEGAELCTHMYVPLLMNVDCLTLWVFRYVGPRLPINEP